jgi:ribonuclease VapC
MTEGASSRFLLDTSALFALIEDEPGAGRVDELLRGATVLIPAVAGLEVYYVTHQERGEDEADRRLALLRQLPAQWLDQLDERVVIAAGRLKAGNRISLADAIIAGFAITSAAVLVHKDPEYEALASAVEQERLPYKQRT